MPPRPARYGTPPKPRRPIRQRSTSLQETEFSLHSGERHQDMPASQITSLALVHPRCQPVEQVKPIFWAADWGIWRTHSALVSDYNHLEGHPAACAECPRDLLSFLLQLNGCKRVPVKSWLLACTMHL